MKRFIFLVAFMFLLIPIMAQVPDVPDNVSDLIVNLNAFLGTLAGLAGVTIFLTGVLVNLLKPEKNWLKMVFAWVVSFILCVVCNIINIGYLAEATWLSTIGWGIGFGLIANGIFDIPTVKTLLDLLLSLIAVKKST